MSGKNLKALTTILVGGKHVAEGEVISKKEFANEGEWKNLTVGFVPPRMEETDEEVGLPVAKKKPTAPVVPQA
jgi:hypothetical protein